MPTALLPYFVRYRWPGNVREPKNIVETHGRDGARTDITIGDLPPFLRQEKADVEALEIDLPRKDISQEAIEKELILRALQYMRLESNARPVIWTSAARHSFTESRNPEFRIIADTWSRALKRLLALTFFPSEL